MFSDVGFLDHELVVRRGSNLSSIDNGAADQRGRAQGNKSWIQDRRLWALDLETGAFPD